MGVETRRAAAAGRHKKQPAILSHEFVIQNHGDIVSAIMMVFIGGLMFNITADYASPFVLPQYNETVQFTYDNGAPGEVTVYKTGKKDLFTLFFYTAIMIVFHAVVQEYVLDKLQRRVHLSKLKMFKFTESGHQFIFALFSVGHAAYIIQEYVTSRLDIKAIWQGYPEHHVNMTLHMKLFCLLQIAYWLHQFPEFYFQRYKKEEIRAKAVPSLIYVVLLLAAYFMHFNRFATVLLFLEYISQTVFHAARFAHFLDKKRFALATFKVWDFVFVAVRLISAVLTFTTFWYGLKQTEVVTVDNVSGNFNTSLVRLNAILILVALQLYQVYNFMSFHVQKYKDKGSKGGKKEKKPLAPAAQKKSKRSDDSESEEATITPSTPTTKKSPRNGSKKTN